jgi:hypothetical protein
MSIELSRPPKPEESQKYSNFNGKTILWMDGWIIKVGEIKSPHAGHKSGLCTTQMKNWKIEKRQIDKQIELELDSTKRRNVHNNERIKESPWISANRSRADAPSYSSTLRIGFENKRILSDIRPGQLRNYIEDEMPTRLQSHKRNRPNRLIYETHVVQMLV